MNRITLLKTLGHYWSLCIKFILQNTFDFKIEKCYKTLQQLKLWNYIIKNLILSVYSWL